MSASARLSPANCLVANMRLVPVAFCIGLNRTGTTTFGDACELLGFTRMGWTYSQAEFPSHRLMRFWEKGNLDGLIETATSYDVLEDLPWPLVYREMAEAFPDAEICTHTAVIG